MYKLILDKYDWQETFFDYIDDIDEYYDNIEIKTPEE